ncbi:MAG: hypothetical protein ACOWWO_09490 [Peptococcaceae bacterium]
MKKFMALISSDLKNIVREPLMVFIMAGPLLYTLVIRFSAPLVAEKLAGMFDLTDYYPLITGFFILLTPLLLGMVTGFMLLDERDEQVLTALIVTPLGKRGYLAYRMAGPVMISFIYTLILVPLLNLSPIPFLQLVVLAALTAGESPLIALFLVNWAGNKVEGLALSKGLGIFLLAPVLAYFMKSNLRYLAGLVPFFWPVEAVSHVAERSFGLYILAGLFLHFCYFILFLQRFQKRIL